MAHQPQERRDEVTSGEPRRSGWALRRAILNGTAPPPCGACKYMRRQCHSGCVFAPYFGTDNGSVRFAAVHRVFGASSVSKLLSRIEPHRRYEAMDSITYEAQARVADPVYGCVSTIHALRQQVVSLQGELAMVQKQMINCQILNESLLQSIEQQPTNINIGQPTFSNNSSAPTNFMNMNFFNRDFDHFAMQTEPTPHNLGPLQFSGVLQEEEHNLGPLQFSSVPQEPIQFSGVSQEEEHNLGPLQFSGVLQEEEEIRVPPLFNNDIGHLIP